MSFNAGALARLGSQSCTSSFAAVIPPFLPQIISTIHRIEGSRWASFHVSRCFVVRSCFCRLVSPSTLRGPAPRHRCLGYLEEALQVLERSQYPHHLSSLGATVAIRCLLGARHSSSHCFVKPVHVRSRDRTTKFACRIFTRTFRVCGLPCCFVPPTPSLSADRPKDSPNLPYLPDFERLTFG